MQRDLPIPDFLKEDVETIHKRMLARAPQDVSTIEGDFFWDNTRPSAEEKADLLRKALQGILKLAFPQSSYGVWLEYCGECKGVFKNRSTKSSGVLKVKGAVGTILEKGKIAGTVASDMKDSIWFEFVETKVINETGITYVNAKCLKEGTIGNVLPNTITILITSINGVESISNEEKFSGGTDIEDEEHFRERVMEVEQEEQLSGADTDYIRWAKEVSGVGYADVIPEWSGPGTTKVLILDKNGQPASKEIIAAVQNYIAPIVPPGQNRGGKAPIGARVTVVTASILTLKIQGDFKFLDGFNPEDVLLNIKNKINDYLKTLGINGEIIFKAIDTIVGNMLLNKEGIKDYNNLTINGLATNIKLIEQAAVVGEVKYI